MKPRQSLPLPEAITADRFTIREGPPCVDLVGRELSIPYATDPYSIFLKAHELAHIRWSPREGAVDLVRRYRLNWEALQAVEDSRMHELLARAGVDMEAGGSPPEEVRQLCQRVVQTGDYRTAALCAVAVYNIGTFDLLYQGLAKTPLRGALELAAEARRRLVAADPNDFQSTVATARWLMKVLGLEPREPGPEAVSVLLGGRDHLGLAQTPLFLPWARPNTAGSGKPSEAAAGQGKPSGLVPWGTMKIEEPDRPVPIPCPPRNGYRATDSGSVLRYPHRLHLDQRVFAFRRRAEGPTLLVDWSGSMRLTEPDVESILAKAPVCQLAVYSANNTEGVLRILAKEGSRVCPEDVKRPSGNCNVIDGPALDWLAKQPGPRLWLCDGQVTGVGDRAGTENTRYTEQVCRQAEITRLENVAAVCAFLAQRQGDGARVTS
jgi:hypothetical protein